MTPCTYLLEDLGFDPGLNLALIIDLVRVPRRSFYSDATPSVQQIG